MHTVLGRSEVQERHLTLAVLIRCLASPRDMHGGHVDFMKVVFSDLQFTFGLFNFG